MSDTSFNGLAGLSGSLLGLTTMFVGLRFYARFKQDRSFRADDWLMIPALVFFISLTALAFYGLSQGFMGYAEPHNIKLVNAIHPEMEKTYFALDTLSVLTLGMVKISVLFFYRRIFCSSFRDAFHIVTTISIAVVALWTLTFFLLIFFVCGPTGLNYLWGAGNSAKCATIYPYLEGSSISDFLLDVLIIFLPIPKIWGLHAPLKRRIGITCVFLLALVGLGAITARLVENLHLVINGRAINDEDAYQSNTAWAYYIILEAGLTIIAANLPSLWYYVADITPEKALRSVRSLASLGSGCGSQGSSSTKVGSTGPNGTGAAAVAKEIGVGGVKRFVPAEDSLDANDSHAQLAPPELHAAAYLVYPEGKSITAYAMTDLGGPEEMEGRRATTPEDGIRVDRSFERTEEQV